MIILNPSMSMSHLVGNGKLFLVDVLKQGEIDVTYKWYTFKHHLVFLFKINRI